MDYNENKKPKRAIAFDFLGVIAIHEGTPFVSEETYLEHTPNQDVVDAMNILRSNGYKIIIYSTLASELISQYCSRHSIVVDEINKNSDFDNGNQAKPVAHVYVDDRAVPYIGQAGEALAEQIMSFKPYWK